MIAVARMHCVVSIAVKNDGRDSQPVPQDRRSLARPGRSREVTLPHGGERRWEVIGGAAGESGMYADRRIQIRVGCPHHRGRGRAGR